MLDEAKTQKREDATMSSGTRHSPLNSARKGGEFVEDLIQVTENIDYEE